MPNSRRQASQRSRQDANLDALDGGLSREEVYFEDSFSPVEKAVGDFIQRVHANIEAEDMIVTGRIDDIAIQQDGQAILVTANRYLVYQDKGVNGSQIKLYDTPFSYKDKRPPIDDIKNWVVVRGIGGDNPDSVAYAIRENIFKEGIAPTHVYSREIPQLVEDIKKEIADFTIDQIIQNF